jgi:hypothetical protein
MNDEWHEGEEVDVNAEDKQFEAAFERVREDT